MKLLSIGNSFSQDAHKWLQKLAEKNGIELKTANLYIGGCSLETHWLNFEQNNEFYDLEINGGEAERKIGISEALKMDDWDVITVQQVSGFSGLEETYEPYISKLAEVVRNAVPNAKLYFHQTWAYETDSSHGDFARYNNDQDQMYDCIIRVTEKMAKKINAELIPVGTVIQHLRRNVAEFDYKNGGISLCRDGFHLTLDYGRFAAAATWLKTLTGMDVSVTEFEDFDTEILKKIVAVVNEI